MFNLINYLSRSSEFYELDGLRASSMFGRSQNVQKIAGFAEGLIEIRRKDK
jgi:hypothetical protein